MCLGLGNPVCPINPDGLILKLVRFLIFTNTCTAQLVCLLASRARGLWLDSYLFCELLQPVNTTAPTAVVNGPAQYAYGVYILAGERRILEKRPSYPFLWRGCTEEEVILYIVPLQSIENAVCNLCIFNLKRLLRNVHLYRLAYKSLK